MPTYVYRCDACKKTQEIKQKMSDPVLTHCPLCQKEGFKRVLPSDVAIQFKGSGFYINDYGKTSSSGPSCSHGGCGKCQ
jgi:putative FmdB family regulatory protein